MFTNKISFLRNLANAESEIKFQKYNLKIQRRILDSRTLLNNVQNINQNYVLNNDIIIVLISCFQ